MAVPSKLLKAFQNFLGLDLRSSDLLRQQGAATEIKNADFRDTGALNKRKGTKIMARHDIGSTNIIANGLFSFDNINIDTGVSTEELLGVGKDLFILKTETITVTHSPSGAAEVPTMSCRLNPTTKVFEFILYEDGTAVSTTDLGNGKAPAHLTISGLETNIDGVTRFACSTPVSVGSEKAAFIPTFVDKQFSANTATFDVYYWSKVTVPNGSSLVPFTGHYARKDQTDFENVSFVDISNIAYFSTGFDALMKYDGNRVYKAGLPKSTFTGTIAESGSGSFTTNEYLAYKANYEYTDPKGNVITGQLSDDVVYQITGTPDTITSINIDEILATSGYNTDQATFSALSTTTITNDTIQFTGNHNFQVDDYVYVDNGTDVLSVRVLSIPTADKIVTDTTCTGTTGVVSTIKVSLWRSGVSYTTSDLAKSALKYLVDEKPNNTAAALAFTDTTVDVSGNIQLIEPVKPHGLAPQCRYMSSWRGQLILSGKTDSVNSVYYSDIDSPEYFPPADNEYKVNTAVTGIGTLDNALYIFQEHAISRITGDLSQDNVSVNEASREGIGCSAAATIQELGGDLWFLSSEGVFSIDSEGLKERSSQIKPKFGPTNPFNFKQAVAINDTKNDKYILYMPVLEYDSGDPISASATASEVYVFDYYRKAWLEWNKFGMMGGASIHNGTLHIMERVKSSTSTPESYTFKIQEDNTEYDYADHDSETVFSYSTHWETLNEPSQWKKFLRIKMHALDTSLNTFESDSFVLTVKTQHDYVNTDIATITIDFAGGALGWGLGPWGNFPWGEPRLLNAKNKLASKKVRSQRVVFSNNVVHENILISGYELQIVTPYKEGMKE